MKIVWYTNKLGRIYVDNMLVGLAHKHWTNTRLGEYKQVSSLVRYPLF